MFVMRLLTNVGYKYSNYFGVVISDFGYDFDCPQTPIDPVKCTSI